MNNYMKTIISGLQQWVSSQKSDWNQNDSSAANYVKNKTHYTDIVEVEVLPKIAYNLGDAIMLNAPFVVGNTYTVIFNDTVYECVAKFYDGWIMIGNNVLYEYDNGDESDTGEPFAIECESGSLESYVYLSETITSSPTLRITTMKEVVHKLDKKYLPDFPSVDDTISISGAAADAKATGDAINAVGALVGDTAVSAQISEALSSISQPDWNQNDPDGAGYIANRTHYAKEPVEREFYSYVNDAPSFAQHRTTKKYYDSIDQVPYFTIGRTYLLTINGKAYEIVAQDVDFLGNQSLSGSYENTGEDFLIRRQNIYFDGDTPPSTINISINEIYEEVIQLDEKFIDYKPGRIVAGKEYVVDIDGVEQTFVAGIGAEVFNDYKWNIAIGEYSHAEGGESIAIGNASHAEGYGSVAADGEAAHAEGEGYAFQYASHAEGSGTASYGSCSHAEGSETEAINFADHAEGNYTVAYGSPSHAEGDSTLAFKYASHAEGYRTVALGVGSHAEGYNDDDNVIEVYISGGTNSNTFTLDGNYDIEVGDLIVYQKRFNYELNYTPYIKCAFITSYNQATSTITTSKNLSEDSAIDDEEAYIYKGGVAAGDYSHIEGEGTFAMGESQHVQGRYNAIDSDGKYAHIVGNGTSANKSNAHTLDWDGNAWFAGDVYVGGTSKEDGNRLVKFSEIPEGTTVDATLSQANQAADAKAVGDAIDALNDRIGNGTGTVSEQISTAMASIKPKCTTINLPAAGWTGSTNPWSQVVAISGVTANSKIDLQPTAIQVVDLQNNDIALMAENDNGVVTVYALGSKPTSDYTMQALITEVVVV